MSRERRKESNNDEQRKQKRGEEKAKGGVVIERKLGNRIKKQGKSNRREQARGCAKEDGERTKHNELSIEYRSKGEGGDQVS